MRDEGRGGERGSKREGEGGKRGPERQERGDERIERREERRGERGGGDLGRPWRVNIFKERHIPRDTLNVRLKSETLFRDTPPSRTTQDRQ